ncbi:MAG: NigD-like protein [Bacteroidales bacterium]|nr:NigD-like protein [Bacteroidales bacterium]
MNNRVYLFILMVGSVFFECSNDVDSCLENQSVAIATVNNPDEQSLFFLDLENNDRLWTASSNFPQYKPSTGQRVIADYTILSEESEGNKVRNIKLNDIYEILTKDLVTIDDSNRDSIGNSSIHIADIWISNDFLNVEFTFKGYNKVHYINLGFNTLKDYNDGKIHLELRHNNNDDVATHKSWGMASFNIKPLQIKGKDSLNIVVHSKSYDSIRERTDELVYNFKDTQKTVRTVTLNKDKGKIS